MYLYYKFFTTPKRHPKTTGTTPNRNPQTFSSYLYRFFFLKKKRKKERKKEILLQLNVERKAFI
jgi:hypothetical protein